MFITEISCRYILSLDSTFKISFWKEFYDLKYYYKIYEFKSEMPGLGLLRLKFPIQSFADMFIQ